MNRQDALDPDVASWLDEQAQAPVPAASRARVLAAIVTRRPWPARMARLGSHWVAEPYAVSLGGRRLAVPALGATSAILLVLVALALIGAAMVVGGRQLQLPTAPGRLVYELGGDVFLAQADGGNPARVGSGSLAPGSIWARDGRHFLYFDNGAQPSAHITDFEGRVVASFANPPGFAGHPVWSPDSTRLHAWTDSTRISIYGLDGGLQSALRLPDGYTRFRVGESDGWPGVWAPDGRSVRVQIIIQGQRYPCLSWSSSPATPATGQPEPPCAVAETWELPIDGSAPRRAADLNTFDLGIAPDGTRVALSDQPTPLDYRRLYVAAADGTDRRPVVQADDGSSQAGNEVFPVWSPSGADLAYFGWREAEEGTVDLRVVDIATGAARTLVDGLEHANWPPQTWSSGGQSWSPDGEQLLFATNGGRRPDGLWAVGVDGGAPTLLVEGADGGEWQPASLGR